MPLDYIITELHAEEVMALINSSIMVESLLTDDLVSSKIMFVSSYVPVEVASTQEETVLHYNITVDPETLAEPRLWFVEINGDCPGAVDYVSTTLEEPLYQGKRGGAVVVVRFA